MWVISYNVHRQSAKVGVGRRSHTRFIVVCFPRPECSSQRSHTRYIVVCVPRPECSSQNSTCYKWSSTHSWNTASLNWTVSVNVCSVTWARDSFVFLVCTLMVFQHSLTNTNIYFDTNSKLCAQFLCHLVGMPMIEYFNVFLCVESYVMIGSWNMMQTTNPWLFV